MNKRRKAYLRQLVDMRIKKPGLSEEDTRYVVSYINQLEKKMDDEQKEIRAKRLAELDMNKAFDPMKEKESIRMILDAEVKESILSLDGKAARNE